MPLLDHFHPPVSARKGWEGVHSQWAGVIVSHLNSSVLPVRYESEARVRLGTRVEVDVATSEGDAVPAPAGAGGGGVSLAPRTRSYAPPAPRITGPVAFAEEDVFEIQVRRSEGGMRLVAAIELVSPSNKDRPSSRRTFATKCAAYLQRGVAVVVVDVVTERAANLHAELVERLHLPDPFDWQPDGLYAVAYRVVGREDAVHLDVWPFTLAVGAELPTVPLWLAADLAVPLDLEHTYVRACRDLRLV